MGLLWRQQKFVMEYFAMRAGPCPKLDYKREPNFLGNCYATFLVPFWLTVNSHFHKYDLLNNS